MYHVLNTAHSDSSVWVLMAAIPYILSIIFHPREFNILALSSVSALSLQVTQVHRIKQLAVTYKQIPRPRMAPELKLERPELLPLDKI